VSIKEFKPATEKENTVITLGRFVPFKNYEAINEVAKFLPEVKFKIIGIKQDIGYYEKIKRTKPKNVFLLTNLTRSEVISELSKAKVYLHTTIGEHFGIAIVEAMASGCIPVVHNSGGAPEVIGDLGHVYNDNKECVDKIREALNADISLNKLVERAKMFDSERFEKEILNLFNKIA
jgi:glycosyltransferase involved in cell wall biosynthesis